MTHIDRRSTPPPRGTKHFHFARFMFDPFGFDGCDRFEEAGCATVCEGSAAAAARGAPAAAWDPHRPVEVATAALCGVRCWDLRTMK